MTRMGAFLIPLLLGFACDSASAFTAAFSRRWGAEHGQWATFVLRNVLGIPLWVIGLGVAVRSPSPVLFATPVLLEALGWVLLAAGCVVQLLALASLRGRAAKPSMADALGILWALLQARLEEVDLLQRMPAYREYLARVPRFMPRVRTRRPL